MRLVSIVHGIGPHAAAEFWHPLILYPAHINQCSWLVGWLLQQSYQLSCMALQNKSRRPRPAAPASAVVPHRALQREQHGAQVVRDARLHACTREKQQTLMATTHISDGLAPAGGRVRATAPTGWCGVLCVCVEGRSQHNALSPWPLGPEAVNASGVGYLPRQRSALQGLEQARQVGR